MRPRGFTLIELMVAGAIGVIVLTTATSFMLAMGSMAEHQREEAALRRSSRLALEQLVRDIRLAGLGIPNGRRCEVPFELLPGAVLQGSATAVGLMGDLPRPDSNLNGIAGLSDAQGIVPSRIYVQDELDNNCDPYLMDAPCKTNLATSVLPSTTPSCGSTPDAPSCPWGLGKYRPGEFLIIADGQGQWCERQLDASTLTDTDGLRRNLRLQREMPLGFPHPNGGFISTPDRVFYRLNDGALERNQCWGSVENPATAESLAIPCDQGPSGTGWETLVRAGAELELTFLDVGGAPLTLPLSAADQAAVARVSVHLVLRGRGGLAEDERVEAAIRSRVHPW